MVCFCVSFVVSVSALIEINASTKHENPNGVC